MTYYVFQQSHIWTAGDPVDTTTKRVTVKGRNEAKARKKLPANDMGRTWVVVATAVSK